MSDAVLLVTFGGPWKAEEIRPFLESVVRGRGVPPARIEEVAHHYEAIGGRSPIGDLTFDQARALEARLREEGPALPVRVGMRSWTPHVRDVLAELAGAGVTRVIAIVLAPHRAGGNDARYRHVIDAAVRDLGDRAPRVVVAAASWHASAGFIAANADLVAQALGGVAETERANASLVFTAHSIPMAMASSSPYVAEIEQTARLVAASVGRERWRVAYQSRSGSPQDPWLEPDINDVIREAARSGARHVVVAPIGFVCDHVEVLYDLDVEAAATAREAGVTLHRAGTVHDHPAFIGALADVVREAAREG